MFWFLIMVLVICLLVIIVVGSVMTANVIALIRAKGVPYVPLSRRTINELKKYIDFSQAENMNVVDMGSGDGRILRLFEANGVKNLTGYELGWWPYLKSRILGWRIRSKAKISNKNFFKVNISQHNVVFCFLLRSMLARMRYKFDKELKPGTIIYSAWFEIENWKKPKAVIDLFPEEKVKQKLFVYKI